MTHNRSFGFTLIEIIIVIVILSVLALGSVQFIQFSAKGYVDTVNRAELASSANIIRELLSRYMINALPGSIRTSASGRCIEWLPIQSATQYKQAPIVGDSAPSDRVIALNVNSQLIPQGYLAIYPIGIATGELYNIARNPGRISTWVASVDSQTGDESTYVFSGNQSFQFEQDSPFKRLFLIGEPMALCQDGQNLFIYKNYGFNIGMAGYPATLPNSIPNRQVIATQIVNNSLVFRSEPASLRRNALVSYQLLIDKAGNSDEPYALSQEVQIKNVP